MNAGVTQRVFRKPFGIVETLRWKGMADKFRIQIQRVIWRTEGESKIVDGKNILDKF